MHRLMRHLAFASLTGMVIAGTAAAQTSQGARALELFQQGVELMKRGDCPGAIAKFQTSLEQQAHPSTAMNLAVCHQRLGELAAAHDRYRLAGRLAQERGVEEITRDAASAVEELERQLSRLIIRVPARGHDDIPDILVTHDGRRVPPERFGEVIYADPGIQRIVASAPGHRSFQARVKTGQGEEVTVEVPVLEPVHAVPTDQPSSPGKTQRILGITGASAGTAALAAGLGFGWAARSAREDAFSSGACDRDTRLCTPAGQARMDTAHRRAMYANILIGTGVVMAGAGLALWLSAPKHRTPREATTLSPIAGPDHVGVAFSGRF